MLTIGIALLLAVATFVAVASSFFGTVAAFFPAIVVFIAAYVMIGRRAGRRVEVAVKEVEKHATAGRIDGAIKALEAMRPLGRWQLLLGRTIDAEIGVLKYAHKRDYDAARPHLERAFVRNWQARAMLGAMAYQRKRYDEMTAVFQHAARWNKKASLLWATWAWCEWKRNKRDRAIEILSQAKRKLPDDELLTKNLLALQNLKKMKMNGYGAPWWALHLEDPPRQVVRPPRWMGASAGVR